MLDFTFEVISESTINVRYLYASEWFTFNLYLKDGTWIIHPFDGMLIQSKDTFRLVLADLLKNKYFHVMCAKENIPLSGIRTSIDIEPPKSGSNWGGRLRPNSSQRDEFDDELDDFIENHSFDDVVENELDHLGKRIDFYKQILQRMFMEGYGPEDDEFQKLQSLIKIYAGARDQLKLLSDGGDLDLGDRRTRRW